MSDFSGFGMMTGGYQGGEVTFAGASSQIPRFYQRPVLDGHASREAGHSVYKQADFVEILTPGERDTVDRPVEEIDRRRWREQWLAYKDGREQVADGTPLTVLFPVNPEIVETLRSARFHTVEQLADAPDNALQAIAMGAYDYQAKAKRFMEQSKDGAKFAKLEKANEDLTFQLKQLQEQVAALTAPKTKKPAAD